MKQVINKALFALLITTNIAPIIAMDSIKLVIQEQKKLLRLEYGRLSKCPICIEHLTPMKPSMKPFPFRCRDHIHEECLFQLMDQYVKPLEQDSEEEQNVLHENNFDQRGDRIFSILKCPLCRAETTPLVQSMLDVKRVCAIKTETPNERESGCLIS